jgi:UDP-GlcNAc:undecaprenyl-phosphate GlcNAc-1-phosphate transferase
VERLRVQNYRGRRVPAVLGLWLAPLPPVAGAVLSIVGGRPVTAAGWGSIGGSALVAAAGFVDDLSAGGPRGVRNHLRALASGRVTTGIVKLVVTGGAAVVVVGLQPPRPAWVRAAGVVLVAGCANLWNGLDVAPGRALKAFVAVDTMLLGIPWAAAPGVPGLLPGAVAALWFDLRERAMLGDAGANLLGFTVGLGLYLALPGWGVAAAAAAVAALNVVAETVSLTRVIAAVPPLRWLDRLGRA